MLPLFAALSLFVAATPPPPKIAMPGLSVIGFEEKYGSFFAEHLAQQLKFEGLDVATAKEIASLLGFERQRQMLGCAEVAGACMAELASALGADGVVLGDLAKVGTKTQLNLKIISARDGKTIAAFSDRVASDELLLDSLSRAARQLAQGVGNALGRTLVPVSGERMAGGPASNRWWWVPVAGGAVVAGVGAVLMNQGGVDYARLTVATPSAPLALSDAQALRDGGKLKQTAGAACVGVGAAAILGGAAWLLLGGSHSSPPAVAWVPLAGGGAVVFAGALP